MILRQFLALILELLSKAVTKPSSGSYMKDVVDGLEPVTKISFILAPFLWLFNSIMEKITTWSLTNDDYIISVLYAIFADWLLGVTKHVWLGTFSIKKNIGGLLLKVFLVVLGGVLFEALNMFFINFPAIGQWLEIIARVTVFLYPALSALESIWILSGKRFPSKRLLDKIRGFYENPTKETAESLVSTKENTQDNE